MGEKLEGLRKSDADDWEPTTIDSGRPDARAIGMTVGAFSFAGERELGRAEDRHMDRK